MTLEWLHPTVRATTWSPLVVVALGLLVAGTLVNLSDGAPSAILGLAAAGCAAAAVAGLHDPAAALLAAVPTSTARRRAHRLALLLPATLGVWLTLVALGQWATTDWAAGWSLGPLAALTSTAVAVAVWAPPHLRVAAGAAAPVTWFVASRVFTSSDGLLSDIAFGWNAHPWTVTAIAVAATTLGRNR